MTTAELTAKVQELEAYIKILTSVIFGMDANTDKTVNDLVKFSS